MPRKKTSTIETCKGPGAWWVVSFSFLDSVMNGATCRGPCHTSCNKDTIPSDNVTLSFCIIYMHVYFMFTTIYYFPDRISHSVPLVWCGRPYERIRNYVWERIRCSSFLKMQLFKQSEARARRHGAGTLQMEDRRNLLTYWSRYRKSSRVNNNERCCLNVDRKSAPSRILEQFWKQ